MDANLKLHIQNGGDSANQPVVINHGGGLVGVGVEPSYQLDVGGDCNITGTYKINGVDHGHVYEDISNPPNIPDSSDYVDLTSSQTVSGIKTWSSNARFNGKIGINMAPLVDVDIKVSGVDDLPGNAQFLRVTNPSDVGCFALRLSQNTWNMALDTYWNGTWSRALDIYRQTGHVGFGGDFDASYRVKVHGSVNVTGNFYVNGNPVAGLADAPSDTQVYGRKDAAWVVVSGGGSVSDLAAVVAPTQVTITNTGGLDATIPAANSSDAGVMTAAHVQTLEALDQESGSFVPGMSISGGTVTGLVHWHRNGDFVTLTGQVSWTSPPTGTGGVAVTGLPYPCDAETGSGFSGTGVKNSATNANGMVLVLLEGTSQIYLRGYNEHGLQTSTTAARLLSSGYINVNMTYIRQTT